MLPRSKTQIDYVFYIAECYLNRLKVRNRNTTLPDAVASFITPEDQLKREQFMLVNPGAVIFNGQDVFGKAAVRTPHAPTA